MPPRRRTDSGERRAQAGGHACPICRRPVARTGKCFPFCTPRCKVVDLGRWLGGDYRLEVSVHETDRDLFPDVLPDHPFEPEDMP